MDKTSWFQTRVLKSADILLAIEMTTHDLDTIFPLAADLLNIQFKTQLLEPFSISEFHNHAQQLKAKIPGRPLDN